MGPEAQIISIGRQVERFLKRKNLARHAVEIPHYSLTGNRHWGKAAKEDPVGFRKFCPTVNEKDIERVAEEVLAAGMSWNIAQRGEAETAEGRLRVDVFAEEVDV